MTSPGDIADSIVRSVPIEPRAPAGNALPADPQGCPRPTRYGAVSFFQAVIRLPHRPWRRQCLRCEACATKRVQLKVTEGSRSYCSDPVDGIFGTHSLGFTHTVKAGCLSSGRSLPPLPSWQHVLPTPLNSDNEHHSSNVRIGDGAHPAAVGYSLRTIVVPALSLKRWEAPLAAFGIRGSVGSQFQATPPRT